MSQSYSIPSVTQWVDATTIRGARAAGIVCAALLALILIVNVWVPDLVGTKRTEPDTGRMLIALVLGMPLSLALALRDPVRNAGVLAVVGLGCGFLGAARVMNAYRGDLALTWSWYLGTVLFFAIGIALVVTYSRLRRPHPIVVRVVIAATVLMPAILWIYDTAAANVGAR
ncbi:MAG: hypothetical protein AUH85_10965 [Chloroflexi bacterium 13_1_40CM_4_68_4]|nr:MAG: hypothetical protein AUH85_10965 [Chloroflexi bacterium 13_1_40CM_4_68_4]